MSKALWQYLMDAYVGRPCHVAKKQKLDYPIQIDDQNDNEAITDFCNIFVEVGDRNSFSLLLSGFPYITPQIADLAEIYDGRVNYFSNSFFLKLLPEQIGAVVDLAAFMLEPAGYVLVQRDFLFDQVTGRTVSSLYRFVRIIISYSSNKRYHFIL